MNKLKFGKLEVLEVLENSIFFERKLERNSERRRVTRARALSRRSCAFARRNSRTPQPASFVFRRAAFSVRKYSYKTVIDDYRWLWIVMDRYR